MPLTVAMAAGFCLAKFIETNDGRFLAAQLVFTVIATIWQGSIRKSTE